MIRPMGGRMTGICKNCGAALDGPYCAQCGQEARDPPERAFRLAAHFVSRAVGYESNAARTLLTLLLRPGRLTAAFVAGRRVRYTSPVQVYLWCTAAFFLVHAYAPFVRLDPAKGSITSSLSAVSVGTELPKDLLTRLARQGTSLNDFAIRFDAAVSAYLPLLLVGLVAVAAGLLALIFRRRPFLTHAMFALHWSAFYFTLEAIRRVLPLPAGWVLRVSILMTLVALVYLAVALRAVYSLRWVGAVLTAFVGIVVFSALLAVWFWSTSVLATYLVPSAPL